MLETWTIREAQAAAELVGDDAVYAVCGAAGLSGASSAELTALCELGRMWADPAGAPVPSTAELDGWETDRLRALTVLWRGLCDGGREDVWVSAAEHEATGDELTRWAYRWFYVQHVAALCVIRRREAEAEAEARATVARCEAELGLNVVRVTAELGTGRVSEDFIADIRALAAELAQRAETDGGAR